MTNEDIISVVAEVERTSKDALEKLMMEADLAGIILYDLYFITIQRLITIFFFFLIGTGDVLRQKWKQDVTDRLEFTKDQKRNSELLPSRTFVLINQ